MKEKKAYEIMKSKIKYEGIGVKNFNEGVFYALIDIEDIPYFVDDLQFNNVRDEIWDIEKSKIYHYTIPSEEGKERICPFCDYQYEDGKPLSEELVCNYLSREYFITSIWMSSIISPTFEDTFSQLIKEINPKNIYKS